MTLCTIGWSQNELAQQQTRRYSQHTTLCSVKCSTFRSRQDYAKESECSSAAEAVVVKIVDVQHGHIAVAVVGFDKDLDSDIGTESRLDPSAVDCNYIEFGIDYKIAVGTHKDRLAKGT